MNFNWKNLDYSSCKEFIKSNPTLIVDLLNNYKNNKTPIRILDPSHTWEPDGESEYLYITLTNEQIDEIRKELLNFIKK